MRDDSPAFACAAAHAWRGDAVLRGVGAADVKSAALLLVSAQPSPFLTTALVVPGAGAGDVSEQLAVAP